MGNVSALGIATASVTTGAVIEPRGASGNLEVSGGYGLGMAQAGPIIVGAMPVASAGLDVYRRDSGLVEVHPYAAAGLRAPLVTPLALTPIGVIPAASVDVTTNGSVRVGGELDVVLRRHEEPLMGTLSATRELSFTGGCDSTRLSAGVRILF